MRSVQAGQVCHFGGIEFEGLSLSGIRTALSIPQYDLSFDVAQGYPFTLKMKKFFLSHGHLDHAAGVPYLISQKALQNEAPPEIFMPRGLKDPLEQIMKIWAQIEDHQYDLRFRGLDPGDEVELNAQSLVRSFQTFHRVESLGYTLFSRNKKRKPEFSNREGAELAQLKRDGVVIEDWIDSPLVSFTGDTRIEFLDSAPWIRRSKVLICEATYLDDRKSIADARKWGHTHLDELIAELDRIDSEKIVLIHLSSRYSPRQIAELLEAKIPQKHKDRVSLFPAQ